MIKNVLLSAICLLLLASCSNKVSLVKRKYNKGFFVSVNKKSNTNKSEIRNENFKVVELSQAKNQEQKIENAIVAIKNEMPATNIQTPDVKSKHEKNHTPIFASAEGKVKALVTKPVVKSLTDSKLTKISHPKKGASDDKIIQIILALFPILCLIAVYLHDGKSITLNFWVTLLLHLTVIGEIIFALLVVLDIINLA